MRVGASRCALRHERRAYCSSCVLLQVQTGRNIDKSNKFYIQAYQSRSVTNLELAKLSVLLLTDGYISKNRNTYEIGFVNTSEILLKMFQQFIKNLFNIKTFGLSKKASGAYVTRFYSKPVAKSLLKCCGTFRTKAYKNGTFPKPNLLAVTNNFNKREIAELLRLAFTLDGGLAIGISDKRTEAKILLKCYNPYLRKHFSRLLKQLDMEHTINREGIFLRKKKSIIDFADRIGFVKGIRIGHDSKRFYGFEKQKLLKIVTKSIKNNSLKEFGLSMRHAGAKTFQCISV